MEHPPDDRVIERLEALERENRWLWRVGAGTFVTAVVFLVEATNLIHPPEILEAQGFILKDSSGRVRGQLRTIKGGSPEFSLLDDAGNEGVRLATSQDNSSSLNLLDRGQSRIEVTASSDGTARLQMTDDGDENRLALFLRNDGTTGQAFESGKRGIHVAVQPDGMAGACVVDERGRELDRLGLLPEEVECVRLNHEIFEPGPAPFRTRVARNSVNPSPLRSLDRHTERAGEGIQESPPLQGGSSHM